MVAIVSKDQNEQAATSIALRVNSIGFDSIDSGNVWRQFEFCYAASLTFNDDNTSIRQKGRHLSQDHKYGGIGCIRPDLFCLSENFF
jgi:hypothetical protein